MSVPGRQIQGTWGSAVVAMGVFVVTLLVASPAFSDFTWTAQMTDAKRTWCPIASSSDGTKLVAAVNSGYLYTSTDSGATWTARMNDTTRSWLAIASSSDGAKLVAAVNSGYLYTSTDSGVTWTPRMTDSGRAWYSIASSADGTKLAAVVRGEYIYTSTDSGVTWTPQTDKGIQYWTSIASSEDGTKLAAAAYYPSGYIFTSTDSGATWTARMNDSGRAWYSITSSSDGTRLAATVYSGCLYTSTDSGATWTAQLTDSTRKWECIASSADGLKLAAVVSGGYIYTGVDPTAIDLVYFGAVPTASGILIKWRTGTEIDNVGFHLWRADAIDGDYSQITPALIPAEGNEVSGAFYSYRDSHVETGERYWYKLEDIDQNGAGTFHGPVSAKAGSIKLVSPGNKAEAGSGTPPHFRWKSVPFNQFQLQFSNRCDFKSGILRLSGSKTWIAGSSYTPTKAQWKKAVRLAGSQRAVYWRVLGKDTSGSRCLSKAFKLVMPK